MAELPTVWSGLFRAESARHRVYRPAAGGTGEALALLARRRAAGVPGLRSLAQAIDIREGHHIAGWAEQLRLDRQRQSSATAGQPKGWLATFLVLVAMAGIVGAGAVAAEAAEEIPQRPIEVASGVLITPADGWEFVGRSDDGESILLTRGSGNLGVSVDPGTDPPEEVLA